jgi:F-type H+-transporting ATPase subunit c
MRIKSFLFLVALMALASPIFAQEGGAAAGRSSILSPGFAMAIASGLCGLGQGKAVGSAVEGMARNPAAAGAIRITLLLGLAFIESLALFTFISQNN